METVNIKMYRATDAIDGSLSMFAVVDHSACYVKFVDEIEPDGWSCHANFLSSLKFLCPSGKERIFDMVDPVLVWECNVKV